MHKSRKIFGILLGIILTPVLLAILALVIINVVDWDKHRPFVKATIERFTDLEIENIEGIKVGLLTSAEAGVDKITFKNSSEYSGLRDFQSGQAYLQLKVFPLLFHKQLIIQNAVLDQATVHLAASKSDPNAVKAEEKSFNIQDLPTIFINSASISDFKLSYKGDKKNADPFLFSLVHAGVTAPNNDKPSMLSAEGKVADLPFEVLGAFGSFDAFRDTKAAYPARIDAKIADHHLEARGNVRMTQSESHFDVDLAGPGITKLKRALKLNIGDIPAYTLSFALNKKSETIRFEEINLQLGNTKVVGNGGLDFSNNRTLIQADLQSPKLFATDLKGLAQTDKNNKEPDEVPKAPGQYFSNEPIKVAALRAVDADIKILVKEFEGQKAGKAIDSLNAHLKMNRGKITINPLNFGVAEGTIGGDLLFDGRKDDIDVKIQLGARRVNLDALLGPIAKEIPLLKIKTSEIAKGLLTGHMDLKMHGRTPMEMSKTVAGPVQLAVENGKLSATLVEAAGLDISETLGDWFLGHPLKKLECSLFSFEADKGVYRTKTILIATTDSNLVGKGQLDLPGNKADFLLTVHPRDFSIGSVRAPIFVRGPLNDIKAGIESKDLIIKSAAALALGAAINPALALVALIEPGTGEDHPCRKYTDELQSVLAKAKEDLSPEDIRKTEKAAGR
ncbi:MAG: AsmA family protein [Oligoflexus sp.]|nr:AsmA family protein [Oligoflexus sp.]